jgi:anti-anti-sigma factor
MKNHFDNMVSIQAEGPVIKITGPLVQSTVMSALEKSLQLLPESGELILNLMGVGQCDSSSLAFLIALIRESSKRGLQTQVVDMPHQMRELSRVSGLEKVISL